MALGAAVFIGGRLIQDRNAYHKYSPRGDIYQSQLAKLEARPLRIPAPKSALDCQYGPTNAAGHLGSGPVYGYNSAGRSVSSWGFYYHNTAYADVNLQGPVLFRALDLYTRQPVIFIGEYAAGPAVGTDTVDETVYEQHLELLINTGNADKQITSHKFSWPFNAGGTQQLVRLNRLSDRRCWFQRDISGVLASRIPFPRLHDRSRPGCWLPQPASPR